MTARANTRVSNRSGIVLRAAIAAALPPVVALVISRGRCLYRCFSIVQ